MRDLGICLLNKRPRSRPAVGFLLPLTPGLGGFLRWGLFKPLPRAAFQHPLPLATPP